MPPMLQGQIQRQHYTPSISQEVLMGNMQKVSICLENPHNSQPFRDCCACLRCRCPWQKQQSMSIDEWRCDETTFGRADQVLR